MTISPVTSTKPIIPAAKFYPGGGSKEEYLKPHTKGRGVSHRKIGIATVAITKDLLSEELVLKKKISSTFGTVYYAEPGLQSAQLSKPIPSLHVIKKVNHTVRRWYRTVYIAWLVASYDAYNGKRWPNSNPPSHRGLGHFDIISVTATIILKSGSQSIN